MKLTNLQTARIGILTGLIAGAFAFFFMVTRMDYPLDAPQIYVVSGGILICSLAGARLGEYWRKTRRAALMGSLLGSFFPILAITLLILMFCSVSSCG